MVILKNMFVLNTGKFRGFSKFDFSTEKVGNYLSWDSGTGKGSLTDRIMVLTLSPRLKNKEATISNHKHYNVMRKTQLNNDAEKDLFDPGKIVREAYNTNNKEVVNRSLSGLEYINSNNEPCIAITYQNPNVDGKLISSEDILIRCFIKFNQKEEKERFYIELMKKVENGGMTVATFLKDFYNNNNNILMKYQDSKNRDSLFCSQKSPFYIASQKDLNDLIMLSFQSKGNLINQIINRQILDDSLEKDSIKKVYELIPRLSTTFKDMKDFKNSDHKILKERSIYFKDKEVNHSYEKIEHKINLFISEYSEKLSVIRIKKEDEINIFEGKKIGYLQKIENLNKKIKNLEKILSVLKNEEESVGIGYKEFNSKNLNGVEEHLSEIREKVKHLESEIREINSILTNKEEVIAANKKECRQVVDKLSRLEREIINKKSKKQAFNDQLNEIETYRNTTDPLKLKIRFLLEHLQILTSPKITEENNNIFMEVIEKLTKLDSKFMDYLEDWKAKNHLHSKDEIKINLEDLEISIKELKDEQKKLKVKIAEIENKLKDVSTFDRAKFESDFLKKKSKLLEKEKEKRKKEAFKVSISSIIERMNLEDNMICEEVIFELKALIKKKEEELKELEEELKNNNSSLNELTKSNEENLSFLNNINNKEFIDEETLQNKIDLYSDLNLEDVLEDEEEVRSFRELTLEQIEENIIDLLKLYKKGKEDLNIISQDIRSRLYINTDGIGDAIIFRNDFEKNIQETNNYPIYQIFKNIEKEKTRIELLLQTEEGTEDNISNTINIIAKDLIPLKTETFKKLKKTVKKINILFQDKKTRAGNYQKIEDNNNILSKYDFAFVDNEVSYFDMFWGMLDKKLRDTEVFESQSINIFTDVDEQLDSKKDLIIDLFTNNWNEFTIKELESLIDFLDNIMMSNKDEDTFVIKFIDDIEKIFTKQINYTVVNNENVKVETSTGQGRILNIILKTYKLEKISKSIKNIPFISDEISAMDDEDFINTVHYLFELGFSPFITQKGNVKYDITDLFYIHKATKIGDNLFRNWCDQDFISAEKLNIPYMEEVGLKSNE